MLEFGHSVPRRALFRRAKLGQFSPENVCGRSGKDRYLASHLLLNTTLIKRILSCRMYNIPVISTINILVLILFAMQRT